MSYILRRAVGVFSRDERAAAWPFMQLILVQLLLVLVLAACGIEWTYLLWVLS